MTERQFRHMVDNRRGRGPAPLFTEGRLASVVRHGAAACARRDDAAEAWARAAEPDWLADTRVVGLAGGLLLIAVGNATLLYDLTQRAPGLHRQLSRCIGGVSRIKFVPAGSPQAEA
ncbi:MAG: hypothetical protein JXO22_03050 [Phycisphaerae bacterium]|nr:hypothetical protein [Phycisphaerae bacterium]